MTFGFFKKLKDGFNKMRKFINYKVLKPAIELMKKAKPILEKVDLNQLSPYIDSSKLDKINNVKNQFLEISDDIINIDEKIKKKDYQGAIEYGGRKFIPRLKINNH